MEIGYTTFSKCNLHAQNQAGIAEACGVKIGYLNVFRMNDRSHNWVQGSQFTYIWSAMVKTGWKSGQINQMEASGGVGGGKITLFRRN